MQAGTVIQKGVVGNLEEPRAEFALVLIAVRGEIGLDQGVLRQVVCFILVPAAEGKQETSQCLLFTLYVGYEYIACHCYRIWALVLQVLLFGFHLLSQHLLAYEIIEEECNAYG